MKNIALTKGMSAIVDDEDYESLSLFKWTYLSSGYAYRQCRINGKLKTILMHRVIMKTQKGELIDHINMNKLDNRKINLRMCNKQQNTANSKSRGGTSKFKGVFLSKRSNKWVSQIQINGVSKHLGTFSNEKEAAMCYNIAAVKNFGEFASLNNVSEENE